MNRYPTPGGAMRAQLDCFRLLDQARRQRAVARQFRSLLTANSVNGTVAFLGDLAEDLEKSARLLEARVANGKCSEPAGADHG